MSVTTHLNRRTALSVLVALVMVLLVVGLQMAKPSKEQNQFAPSFKRVGAVGKPIEMREGTLTISGVRVAKTLETSGFLKKKLITNGYWLIVDYKFTQKRESEGMDANLYTPDNTKYSASLRPSTSTNVYAEPGFPTTGVLVFEVAKSAIAGSRLVVGNGGLFGLPLWDDQAVVSLGIDEARAKRLLDNVPPVTVLEDN